MSQSKKREREGETIEDEKIKTWECILKHCGASARTELIEEAIRGHWIRNCFHVSDFATTPKDKRQLLEPGAVTWVPDIFKEDVLVRIWVTMSRTESRAKSMKNLNPVNFLKTYLGSGLHHEQFADVAEEARAKNLSADHALIEFRRPAKGITPAQSWSIGFAGNKGALFQKGGDASVRSYDWWMNDKLWKAANCVRDKKGTATTEIPAVLIGMGKMSEESKEKMKNLLTEASYIQLAEKKSDDDFRVYLGFQEKHPFHEFRMLAVNNIKNIDSIMVQNCIGFAQYMFPDIIQCMPGVLMPGRCSGLPPAQFAEFKCPDSKENCSGSSQAKRQKKTR